MLKSIPKNVMHMALGCCIIKSAKYLAVKKNYVL